MVRFTRRLKWFLALIFLGLLGLGAGIYYAVYLSTGTALERAESFLFRRMQVARLSEQGVYRYFYVTNRRPVTDEGPVEERFGNERAETLKFGSFDTGIERSLGLGMLINRTDWFQNEEIQIRKMRRLERAAFVEELRQLVRKSPHRSLLVVVHGFREAFPSALRKTAFVGHILDIDSPVLLFDWPGNQGSSLRGYRRARQVAKSSATELAETLLLIIREVEPEKLWLIANSMGGEVVAHAFGLLYQEPELADREPEFEDVVLTAPDVSHEEFDRRFKREMAALTRDLTVYVSSNDRALVMSRLVNRERRRGESTVNTSNPDQLEEAARVADLLDPDEQLVTLVDVTPVNRTRNFHNFSLETPEFFNDLYLRLMNADQPRSRLLYTLRTAEGNVYWILTRGR